ncbi:MAG: tetraacyldisaccharide 4'-kinase [Betaproteobacteria bacterium AqS2]|uniref:Tetraacyldisaccharide 4'-kinase n=1 Tax=Candidatus Amphirhobacter heronislandensis TaxID=1732024 RepID=A0A930UIT9_9GAMM|nr:tetraacyldisaccharide 4'-kinase [Betaproteobacteria bacterium AqS2]
MRRLWRRRTWRSALLLPAAGLFWLAAALRRAAYRRGLLRSWRCPLPVVVVGCLTAGGGGKTPTVLALARQLRARGRRPGVVSRGYGRAGRVPMLVTEASAPAEVGDEPLLLHAAGLPAAVGADRPAAARLLLANNPGIDVVISDDGLQHYALQRDVEIVVLSAGYGLGNRWPLPAGPLREPASRLAAVDWVVRRGGPAGEGEQELKLESEELRDRTGAPIDPAELAKEKIAACAGIAEPEAFFAALRRLGIEPVRELAFADHHRYQAADLAGVDAPWLATTAKDAIKLPPDGPDRRVAVLEQRHVLPAPMVEEIDRRTRQA